MKERVYPFAGEFGCTLIINSHPIQHMAAEAVVEKRVRNARWCFTINNPTGKPLWNPVTMDYLCFELEHSSEDGLAAGTPHYQGYVRFKAPRGLSGAKEPFGTTAHMEIARGNESQNKEYCSKEKNNTFEEFGVYNPNAGKKGHRSDLTAVAEALKEHKTIKQVAEEFPETYIKYFSGIEKLSELTREPVPIKRDVHTTVLWGTTGVGKSHRVCNAFPDNRYNTREGPGCWDTYEGEQVIFFDEFDFHQWPIRDMDAYLDVWRCPLKARYHNREARYLHVIIAANSPPEDWYIAEDGRLKDAFMRRLTDPMGKIFEVRSRDQVIDFAWWKPEPSDAELTAADGLVALQGPQPLPVAQVPPIGVLQTHGMWCSCDQCKKALKDTLPSGQVLWDHSQDLQSIGGAGTSTAAIRSPLQSAPQNTQGGGTGGRAAPLSMSRVTSPPAVPPPLKRARAQQNLGARDLDRIFLDD